MPYKDPQKRYEAVLKSKAKKPDLYRALNQKKERARSQRGYHIKRRYGVTTEDYDRMLSDQNGGCKLCGKPPAMTSQITLRLFIDHCHTTGKVRGLLCARCNTGLGFVDQSEWLSKALEYREAHS